MKVNNYPLKTPAAGDKLFGSDSVGNQKQFEMTAVSNNVFQYEIGEYVADEGGVIFHRYLDGNTQNYLVVTIINQSFGQDWSNVSSTLIGSTAQSTWDGLSNSNAIVGQAGFTNGAAKTCLDLVLEGKNDWYLPAIDELLLLANTRFNVNKTLSGIIGSQIISQDPYWSSTEQNSTNAIYFSFPLSQSQVATKISVSLVRAVRKFSI